MVDQPSISGNDSFQRVEPVEKTGSGALATLSIGTSGLRQPASIPPILIDRRSEHHRHHHEKMPPEGSDLIRGGFAITSAALAVLAFIGSWISSWAVLPCLLAIVTAPPGIFSRRKLLAMIGVALGLVSLSLIIGGWMVGLSR